MNTVKADKEQCAPAKGVPVHAMQRVIDAPNQFVEVSGSRKLAYRSVGEGKSIVLCVRFRGNMDDWDPAFLGALVMEGFRVITFDYTGLGLSEGGTPSYSPLSLADDANDLIQALQLKDAVIGGWSLGGLAAQAFIANYGHTVSHGVLIATAPPGPNVKGSEQLFHDTALKPLNDLEEETILFNEPKSEASRLAARRTHDRLKLRTAGRSNAIPLEFAAPALGNTPRSPLFPAEPILEALKRTKLPLLHLGADHDIVFPVENWYALSQALPTLHLHTFPQSGHGPQHQYPVEAAKTIAGFVFGSEHVWVTDPNNRSDISLSMARKLIDAAEHRATCIGVKVSIVILDRGGDLVTMARMDGAWPGAFDLAIGKACTARAFHAPSAAFTSMMQPGEPLFGVNTTRAGRYVLLGGGIPLLVDGEVVGAIGVSGGTTKQDIEIAEAAINGLFEPS